jgi:hypothetical protein
MWKNLLIILFIFPSVSFSQSASNQLAVKNSTAFDKVNLYLTGTSGICLIKPAIHNDVLNVKKSDEALQIETYLQHQIKDRVNHIYFQLNEKKVDNMGKALSNKIFRKKKEDKWYVYLSRHKPYNLTLNYPVGDAHADFSGLPIENIKIKTGNADVKIGYFSRIYNPVEMDTFMAHVDFGSLQVAHLNMAKAKTIIADVGFGSLLLDFSDECKNISQIKVSVGAGKLTVNLPEHEVPVMIKLNDSPLCRVKIPEGFSQTAKNIFVNAAYLKNPDPRLTFDVDVALGNILFE